VVALLVAALLSVGAVWTNVLGVGVRFQHLEARVERLIAGPVPDRATLPTVEVTDPRSAESLPPASLDVPSAAPSASVAASPTASPPPVRKAVDVNIESHPKSVFASELTDVWCAPAGVQTALAILGLADNSNAFQRKLVGQIGKWESWQDSHNGGWGPASMALAMAAYGAPGYQVRAYATRAAALADAARAIAKTHAPVILLAWRGAHTWVMSGYRANADPTVFVDATVTGAYILDPWYPAISTIWGPSDPPGTFQNNSEMIRNYLAWKRPEGTYPTRDGKWISVVPTVVVKPPA
jgi:hypothetical protein